MNTITETSAVSTDAPVKPAELPTIPAETLERIGTAPKRLAASRIPREPATTGETRKTSAPRAWTMGGRVD